MNPKLAKLTSARKILATMYSSWKHKTYYQENYIVVERKLSKLSLREAVNRHDKTQGIENDILTIKENKHRQQTSINYTK